jgi:NADPH-dependent F420 reductase
MEAKPTIGIVGGTGDLGSGLAKHWARAGYEIILGSRSKEKAASLAVELRSETGGRLDGEDNLAAARRSDVVVIAVPFASHEATLKEIKPALKGKIVIDAVVALAPPKVSLVQLPSEGSAAAIARNILGDEVRLVSAFHNVGASKLHSGEPVNCDVLVFGDDPAAREEVIGLAEILGTRGIHGGPLANSAAAEAMTSVLISINRRYKVAGAGIRITGLAAEEQL